MSSSSGTSSPSPSSESESFGLGRFSDGELARRFPSALESGFFPSFSPSSSSAFSRDGPASSSSSLSSSSFFTASTSPLISMAWSALRQRGQRFLSFGIVSLSMTAVQQRSRRMFSRGMGSSVHGSSGSDPSKISLSFAPSRMMNCLAVWSARLTGRIWSITSSISLRTSAESSTTALLKIALMRSFQAGLMPCSICPTSSGKLRSITEPVTMFAIVLVRRLSW